MLLRLPLLVGFVFSILHAAEPCWNAPKPCYIGEGLVNSADFLAGELAPGSIASLFGTGLSYTTYSIALSDIAAGILPTTLPSTGVHVLVGSIPAPVLYVSPKQINFIVPNNLLPGQVSVQVVLDSNAGPSIGIRLKSAAPALFQLDSHTAIAQRPDGSLYTDDSPARPGDWITLYATGLGQTIPPLSYRELPRSAAWIANAADLRLLLNGVAVDSTAIGYAGVAPGFGGLNQINLRLPADIRANPEIQLALEGDTSPPGISIPAKP
jgi:uncharacterized protein (TIGR03437 family)